MKPCFCIQSIWGLDKTWKGAYTGGTGELTRKNKKAYVALYKEGEAGARPLGEDREGNPEEEASDGGDVPGGDHGRKRVVLHLHRRSRGLRADGGSQDIRL